jgi:hypothetical protein
MMHPLDDLIPSVFVYGIAPYKVHTLNPVLKWRTIWDYPKSSSEVRMLDMVPGRGHWENGPSQPAESIRKRLGDWMREHDMTTRAALALYDAGALPSNDVSVLLTDSPHKFSILATPASSYGYVYLTVWRNDVLEIPRYILTSTGVDGVRMVRHHSVLDRWGHEIAGDVPEQVVATLIEGRMERDDLSISDPGIEFENGIFVPVPSWIHPRCSTVVMSLQTSETMGDIFGVAQFSPPLEDNTETPIRKIQL